MAGFVFYKNRSDAASVAFGAAMAAYQSPIATPGQVVPPEVKTYSSVAERAKSGDPIKFASKLHTELNKPKQVGRVATEINSAKLSDYSDSHLREENPTFGLASKKRTANRSHLVSYF